MTGWGVSLKPAAPPVVIGDPPEFRTSETFLAPTSTEVLTLPAAAEVGDLMFLVVTCRADSTLNEISGWASQALLFGSANSTRSRMRIHTRVRQAGDTSVTLSGSGSNNLSASIVAYTPCQFRLAGTLVSDSTSGTTIDLAPAAGIAPAYFPALQVAFYGTGGDGSDSEAAWSYTNSQIKRAYGTRSNATFNRATHHVRERAIPSTASSPYQDSATTTQRAQAQPTSARFYLYPTGVVLP